MKQIDVPFASSCGRIMKQINVPFAWSCGGLDAAAQNLADLEPSEVPDADPPLDTRGYLEKMGYKVRHKYNKQELQSLSKNNKHHPVNNRQKHKTQKTIGKKNGLQPVRTVTALWRTRSFALWQETDWQSCIIDIAT